MIEEIKTAAGGMMDMILMRKLQQAGYIHAKSWQAAHLNVCSPEFIAKHSTSRQTAYLMAEMAKGKRLFMLTDEVPVGVVTVWYGLIENLYVLPEAQGCGYGSQLLEFAVSQCDSTPTLWILSSNVRAQAFYQKRGFRLTGKTKQLSDELFEMEMKLADA